MANLLGQNIGTNYKGILNLNTLNGNLSGTLESVTDGDGNASALQLSTSLSRISANLTIGGSTTASARLHVRGDGTNPIARFENSSGSSAWAITATGSALTCESQARIQGPAIANDSSVVLGSFNNLTTTTLTQTILTTQGNIVCAAGSGNKRISSIEYGINNSGAQTGTATGIFLNATETALNGMTHNLMDLQVGGVSRVIYNSNSNILSIGGSGASKVAEIYLKRTDGQNILSLGADGVIGTYQGQNMTFQINSVTQMLISSNTAIQFNYLVRFAGATNAFPALKRNGAGLEVRLADDSATTALNAASFNTVSCTIGSNFMSIGGDSGFLRPAASTIAISLNGFSNNHFEFRKNSDTTVVGIIKGTGSPEGVITANQGSIFLRTDGGGASEHFYVKESGSGNTGWVGK